MKKLLQCFLEKHLIGDSFKNIFEENTFTKNTSNRKTIKHIFRVHLIVKIFSLKIFLRQSLIKCFSKKVTNNFSKF